YHKDEEISSSIKYEETFISSSIFEWMSKNKRTLNSPEIKALAAYDGSMRIPLFVKKSDDEGTDFYYIGELSPIKSSFFQTTIKGNENKDVSVVKVQFNILPSVEDSIYTYLTKV
ncbi:MAG TPA: DUF3427 domain-containing protein, partial [Chitinophagaceae bacterium]|nr:DUF3427 domain-containing protein [Chitinophagaceae bacterium]